SAAGVIAKSCRLIDRTRDAAVEIVSECARGYGAGRGSEPIVGGDFIVPKDVAIWAHVLRSTIAHLIVAVPKGCIGHVRAYQPMEVVVRIGVVVNKLHTARFVIGHRKSLGSQRVGTDSSVQIKGAGVGLATAGVAEGETFYRAEGMVGNVRQ